MSSVIATTICWCDRCRNENRTAMFNSERHDDAVFVCEPCLVECLEMLGSKRVVDQRKGETDDDGAE